MPKRHQSTRDMRGTPIAVGSRVWVTPFARLYKAHPEFRREFRKVAGQIRTVVGFDVTGGVWLGLGRYQVITVDRSLLKIMGMADARPGRGLGNDPSGRNEKLPVVAADGHLLSVANGSFREAESQRRYER